MSGSSYRLKGKTYGTAEIICIAVFSIGVYIFTLSILSVAAIYTFLMIKTIMLEYSRYIGYLNKKSIFIVGAISFLTICIGYYFAYATYYYPYFNAVKGCSYINVLLNLPSLLNGVDKAIAPGSLFFILFSFVCGMAMNKQYIKHEQVNEINIRLNEFKKEVGMENEEGKDSKLKKTKTILFVVGFLTLGLGIFNDYRFSNYISINRYKKELSELKEINKEAYNRAKDVLKGQGTNYYYCSYDYYVRGENNLLHITANLDGDNYVLYCDQESYGTSLDMNWGDWAGNGITLEVKAKGEGYAIVIITNDVNDECIEVFVDNFDYK